MRFPSSSGLTSSHIGWNSPSSSSSAPMAGQPKAMASKEAASEAVKSAAWTVSTSAPLAAAPSATAPAMASVLPVPLQKTTAILLISISFPFGPGRSRTGYPMDGTARRARSAPCRCARR